MQPNTVNSQRTRAQTRGSWYLVPALLSLLLLSPARAADLSGGAGLLLAPTADYVGRGSYAFGITTVDEHYRPYYKEPHATVLHYYHIGLSGGIDVTMGITNFDGRLFAQKFGSERPLGSTAAGTPAGGWNIDRSLSARLLLLRQGRHSPSLALGMRDITGTSNFGANYLVASYRFPKPVWDANATPPGIGVHLGIGTNRLHGLFGGIDYWPTSRLGVMAETVDGRVHAGLRWRATRQFQIQPSLMGLRWLGGGIAYAHRM
ncbi:MAG TPA: YjbH domain-containing protein [Armatimonadota bacterium]|nr:YjbH domain-containing protein [Armatimonadota bacterium]HPO73651.1 YjbH domain-containing protein [Armatimonadota bacterium]